MGEYVSEWVSSQESEWACEWLMVEYSSFFQNKHPHSAKAFQILTSAYEILGDVVSI